MNNNTAMKVLYNLMNNKFALDILYLCSPVSSEPSHTGLHNFPSSTNSICIPVHARDIQCFHRQFYSMQSVEHSFLQQG